MNNTQKTAVHIILIFMVLIVFTRLRLDALVLGTAAIYLYQRYKHD